MSSIDEGWTGGDSMEPIDDDPEIITVAGTPDAPPPPRRKLGQYEILKTIGSGGMAEVFLASSRGLAGFEKLVVLKCIHPHLAREEHFVQMFLDEARLAARINDPRVVQIHELGEQQGTYFMAMEYLAGESLTAIIRSALRGGPAPSPHLVARIVAETAAGLHAAHELRDDDGHLLDVVHRDVSHGNVIVLHSGVVKVLDFGVAKARSSLSTTVAGERKGKYGYMSPEQILGDSPVDRRSDIFSLGVVLWEALTRKRLFLADSEPATLRRVLDGVPPPPSSLDPKIPAALDAIALRALAKDPAHRYQTAEDMREAIEAFLRRSGVPAGAMEITSFMTAAFRGGALPSRKISSRSGVAPLDHATPAVARDASQPAQAPSSPMPQSMQPISNRNLLTQQIRPLTAPRNRRPWIIAAIVAPIALAGAFAIGRQGRGQSPVTPVTPVAPPPELAVAPRPTPVAPPPVPTPTPTPAPEKSLGDSLFDRAEAAVADGRITEPPGDNALELLYNAESLAPGDARVAVVREKAVTALLASAGALWDHGKLDSARLLYADVLRFDPAQEIAKARAAVAKPTRPVAPPPANPDEIAWLVSQIDLAIIENRLVAPPGHNALESLLRLRKIDPNNDVARQRGAEVATALEASAKDQPAAQADKLIAAAHVANNTGNKPAGVGAGTGSGSADANDHEKKREPALAADWVAKGNQQLGGGHFNEAQVDYERAIAADSNAHAALAGLSEVAYNEGDYARAVIAAKRAVALSPRSPPYHMELAKAYYKLLRYDDAISQWKKVLELDPRNSAAQKNIEMAERREGK